MIIDTSYFICTTPRSGSYLLCEALISSGLAGRPSEYFLPTFEKLFSGEWGTWTYREYLERLFQETATQNGVFGAKVHWASMHPLLEKLGQFPEWRGVPAKDVLNQAFHNPRFIWLTRRVKVRQAISYSKAMQTGIWWDKGESPTPRKEPVFEFQ